MCKVFNLVYIFHISSQVPANPPFLCPVAGCGYIARDSRQSLVRHFGMTHKVVVELLKQHAPDYDVGSCDVSDSSNPENGLSSLDQQLPQAAQQQYYPQQDQFQPQYHQHQQQQYNPPSQDYLLQAIDQQQQLEQQQPPQYLPVQQQQQTSDRFEPQIDGTFDPSIAFSDLSSTASSSVPSTPVKQQVNVVTHGGG